MKVYKIHRAYEDNYKNHQMLKEIFPGEGKLLYQRSGSKMIVLTDICIVKKFSESFEIEYIYDTKDVVTDTNGSMIFSIRLNAVKSNQRKRFSLHREELDQWVDNKLSGIGITVRTRSIIDEGTKVSNRGDMKCFHSSILVNGMLDIDDVDKFLQVIHNGIGHGKAFGFGMMNIFG